MPRTPFAIMFAMTSFLVLPVSLVHAQDSATDATTPIDKAVGNLDAPTDNTLSNDEVIELERQQRMGAASRDATAGMNEPVPSVSGTTPVYKAKSGSAAATEGGNVVQ